MFNGKSERKLDYTWERVEQETKKKGGREWRAAGVGEEGKGKGKERRGGTERSTK